MPTLFRRAAAAAVGLAATCTAAAAQPATPNAAATTVASKAGPVAVERLAKLDNPWGMAALPDGRLLTADRARWDEGRLVVLGRVDDVVVSGGINVDLAAVEQQVRGWPGLGPGDVAVVGVPDPEWGTAVVAVLERERWSGAEEQRLREHLQSRLPSWATPRRLLGRAPLPRTSSGKIDRLRLVAELSEGRGADA